MKAAHGRVTDIRSYTSLQVTKIVIEIPIESHVLATELLYGKNALVTVAPASLEKVPYGVFDPVVQAELPPKPEEPKRTGLGMTALAGVLCKDRGFQVWASGYYAKEWAASERDVVASSRDDRHEQKAAIVVRTVCRVESRAEFDKDPAAAMRFEELIRKPFIDREEQAT